MHRPFALLAVSLSIAVVACGGGDDSSEPTDTPSSADVNGVIQGAGFGLSCDVKMVDGPPIENVAEHKLLQCDLGDGTGGTTLGSYYRYDGEPKGSYGTGPRFQNGNVVVVIADVNEAPKELPAKIKESCKCGEVVNAPAG